MTTAMLPRGRHAGGGGRGVSLTLPNINKIHSTPRSYTFTLHRSIPPQDMTDPYSPTSRHIRTAQLSSVNSTADFVNRSSLRPTTTPAVVGFEGVLFAPVETPRGIINGFFPPVKRQGSVCASETYHDTPRTTASHRSNRGNDFAPAPSPSDLGEYQELRHRHSRSHKKKVKQARAADGSIYHHKEAATRSQTQMTVEDLVLPGTHPRATNPKGVHGTQLRPNDAQAIHSQILAKTRVSDVSELPRPPKMIMGHRDVPFVYRYKVKKNMSRLSKIMTSTPPVKPDHIW